VTFVVTLQLDPASFAAFDGLRGRHFPPERNFVPAHVTLFHQLPEGDEAAVAAALATAAAATIAFPLEFTGPRSLGRGVAFDVKSDALLRLRRRLADAFEPWLTPQDAQGFRPHVTVQNKATAEAARELLAALTASTRTGSSDDPGSSAPRGAIEGQDAEPVPPARLASCVPRTGRAEGLLLWRYAGGPWDAVDAYPFRVAREE
jgi:2'-5' RNA ligase